MKTNQLIFIVSAFLLVFGYQNCQKAENMSAENSLTVKPSDVHGGNENYEVIPLSSETLERFQYKSDSVVKVQDGKRFYSLIKTLIYDVDLGTGEVQVSDQGQQTNERYCLTPALKDSLYQKLSSSDICKGSRPTGVDEVCAAVIKEGYAQIFTNRDQFQLGYASNSCGQNQVDLCGDQPKDLKAFFVQVISQLPQLACGTTRR